MKTHKSFKTAKITFIIIGLMITIVLTKATNGRAATWAQKTDMPTARMGFSTSVVDGKIYAIGALQGGVDRLTKVEEYDPATDTWAEKADMPTTRTFIATSVVDGLIYAIGGTEYWGGPYLATVEVYDPVTDTWTRKTDMPAARSTEIVAVDGIIYAIGGYRNHVVVATVEAYDPVTDTWTKKADMPTARGLHSISVVNGKIYALGGQTQSTFDAFATVEVYDPETDTWTRKGDMPVPRIFPTCVVDDKIFGFGGRATRGGAPLSTVLQCDTVTDTWAEIDTLPVNNSGMGVSAVGGMVYVIGGSSANYPFNSVLSTVWEYDTGLGVTLPDFNGDEIVDMTDFSVLARYWHQEESSVDTAPGPFGDGVVDHQDLAVLGEYWLQEIPPVGLVAHWKLDQTEGYIAYDDSGNRDGTLVGEPQWQPVEGAVDGALALDGVNDLVYVPFVLNPSVGAFSVFLWVKTNSADTVIISQRGTYGASWLAIDGAGRLTTELQGSGRGAAPLTPGSVITDNQWHRVGFTWDDAYRRLYVDDVEVAGDTSLQGIVGADGGLHIGADKTPNATSHFSGLIDDIRIYDRAIVP